MVDLVPGTSVIREPRHKVALWVLEARAGNYNAVRRSLSTGCVRGGGRSMSSFYLFLYINGFFVAIQACFHLVGVI